MASSPPFSPQTNLILAALSPSEMQLLAPHLKHVDLSRDQTMHEEGEVPQRVYFLTSGVATLSISTSGGREMELSLVGREGIVGERAIFDGGLRSVRCSMLTEGHAYSLSPAFFRTEFQLGQKLHDLVMRTLEARLAETSQTALCNHMHLTEQRIARWLLCLSDRLNSCDLAITQETSARMLGMHRPGISLAMSELREAGVLEYSRGHLTITNRRELEKRACECYGLIKDAMNRAYCLKP